MPFIIIQALAIPVGLQRLSQALEPLGKVKRRAWILHCPAPSQLNSSFMPLSIHGSLSHLPCCGLHGQISSYSESHSCLCCKSTLVSPEAKRLHEKETFRFISSGALLVYTEPSVHTPGVEEGTGIYEAPALLPHLIPQEPLDPKSPAR